MQDQCAQNKDVHRQDIHQSNQRKRNRKRSKRRGVFCPIHGCYLDQYSGQFRRLLPRRSIAFQS
jgi:hypothetical protein